MIKPDIFADIKFYKTEEGGRKSSTAANFFGCIFVVDESKHDCRLLLESIGAIHPGENKINIPIKFLDSSIVMPKLKIGSKFYLWDMRNIAEGTVKIIN